MISLFETVFISPLKLIFEFVFAISHKLIGSVGISIAVLSFVLNIILLPLYKKADEIQEEENRVQKLMKPDIDFIKETFSGNEQFMILQTYYRKHNYKPIYVLRNSISLMLQIPFFIAAYSFLSNLELLKGASFGPFISDLSKPDGLLFGLNLFPILMTIINVISCIVYTKGQPLKSQMQLYIMAVAFLFLLYNAPAGLSLYYLLNNLFSLVKNILAKTDKRKIIPLLVVLACIAILLYVNPNRLQLRGKLLIYGFIILSLSLSLLVLLGKNISTPDLSKIKNDKSSFMLCTIYLFILTGLLIPNSVIQSSPEEFINKYTLTNPLRYVFETAMLSFGLFVIWFNIFYALMESNLKKMMTGLTWISAGIFTLCYLFFNNDFGTMSNTLIYDIAPSIPSKTVLINLILIAFLAFVSVIIMVYKPKVMKNILIVLCITSLTLSIINVSNTNKRVNDSILMLKNNIDYDEQILPLSRTNKNVIVLMLDRAISFYFPYILNEKPELQEQFAGFTFYPNTISFGPTTNIGAPGIYGGYEYIPEEMNKRDSELLVDKHDEALKVMPVLFSENNYRVVVCDPPYAGYGWIPDLTIYKDYPDIKAYMTEGRFLHADDNSLGILKRNLFVYSLSKICPSFLFNIIYDQGNYLNLNITKTEEKENEFVSGFKNWFETIKHFEYMSFITEDDKGSFLMIQNSATHEPVYLSETDYTIDNSIDQTKEDTKKTISSIDGNSMQLEGKLQITHYDVNVATMIELGKWFDYLRENDVYDNTKIIIVSDHGRNLHLDEKLLIDKTDLLYFNALYLVKDFNSDKFIIDNSFMTNADTPYLATKDIIQDPKNPFTGKDITYTEKEGISFNVYESYKFSTDENNGYTFVDDGRWLSVHDDCLDINNWNTVED